MLIWYAAGAVLTVGTAWTLAAILPQEGWIEYTDVDTSYFECGEDSTRRLTPPPIHEYTALGSTRRSWAYGSVNCGRFLRHLSDWYPSLDCEPIHSAQIVSRQCMKTIHGGLLEWPRWGSAQVNRERLHHEDYSTIAAFDGVVDRIIGTEGCEHATGWPVRAIWYELQLKSGLIAVDGGIALSTPMSQRSGMFLPPGQQPFSPSVYKIRALPLRPIWAGLSIDSAVLGAVAWMVVQAARDIQQRLRRRRGLCPRCAYDLRHRLNDGCPECGWNRPESVPPHPCALQ